MTPLPLDKLDFTWRGHLSALWWFWMLYRRPMVCQDIWEKLRRSTALGSGLILYCHATLWVFVSVVFVRFCSWYFYLVEDTLFIDMFLPFARNYTFDNYTFDVAFGIVFGIVFGIALGIALGITLGITLGIAVGIAFGIAFGIVFGIGFGITVGIAFGITVGIAVGIAVARAYYVPLHLFFLLSPGAGYRFHPVAWDDMCGVPYWRLERILVGLVGRDPEFGRREIARIIDTYPAQRMGALRAAAILTIRDAAANLGEAPRRLLDLPDGEKGFLRQVPVVKDFARGLAADAREFELLDLPTLKRRTAEKRVERIRLFRESCAGLPYPLGEELRKATEVWLGDARKVVASFGALDAAPQVFRAGDPVNKGREAFLPRWDVLQELARQALLATGCPGLLLYGRRRTGKTSTLQSLDGLLVNSVFPTWLSMQDPRAFSGTSDLCALIADHLRGALAAMKLPAPETEVSDLRGLMTALDAANRALEGTEKRLLLGVDEYENLDTMIGEGKLTLDFLSTVRESIQNHRNLIWLFAGSHHVAELTNAEWSSYLISVRMVPVRMFTAKETRTVLTDPLRYSGNWEPDDPTRFRFAPEFWGEGGTEWIHEEAGGWPHLVQLLAEAVVDEINDRGTAAFDPAWRPHVLRRSIERGEMVLRQLTLGECRLPGELDYVRSLVSGDRPAPEAPILSSLRRRELIVEEGGRVALRVPLMRRWLENA